MTRRDLLRRLVRSAGAPWAFTGLAAAGRAAASRPDDAGHGHEAPAGQDPAVHPLEDPRGDWVNAVAFGPGGRRLA